MEGWGEEGAPTASGGKSSTRTVGSEQQATDQVGGAVVDKLGPGDLRDVLTELFDVRADWENIGLALKLTDGTLRAIKGPYKDPKDCLRDMLTDWLNTSDGSWSSLVDALRQPIVGRRHLAAELEGKYLRSQQSAAVNKEDRQTKEKAKEREESDKDQKMEEGKEVPPDYEEQPTVSKGKKAHQHRHRHQSSHRSDREMDDRAHKHSRWRSSQEMEGRAHKRSQSQRSLSRRSDWEMEKKAHRHRRRHQSSHRSDQEIDEKAHKRSRSQRSLSRRSDREMEKKVHQHRHRHQSSHRSDREVDERAHEHSRWRQSPSSQEMEERAHKRSRSQRSLSRRSDREMEKKAHQHRRRYQWSDREMEEKARQHRRRHQSSHWSGREMVRERFPHSSDSEPEVKRRKYEKPHSLQPRGKHRTSQALVLEEFATSSHAAAKPSTPDPQLGPMELFAESLMAEYERVSAACEEKLYPTPTTEYTNLAVIKKEKVSRAKANMFTRSTLHGGLDEIMREKTPVNLEDVFKPDGKRQAVNYVLVEGAPGVGKSTFALELCRRWQSIELMKRFVAVVLLRLRERRVQKAKSLSDLLYHEDDDIKQDVVKQVRSSSGKNLLLVLDGFDELPSHLQQSGFIAELMCGRCLRKATILVTSRRSARDSLLSLRSHPDKHIEVLGFTSILVDKYANSVYGEDLQLLADFRTYINTNPAIKSMMYVPLNSAIVVEIYREYRTEGRPIPQTMTQLYTELTLLRIRSYLRDQCKQPLDSLPEKLEDLPKEFRDQLFSLAELAFNGCKNEEVIFERLPVGCTCLGLMTASQEMYVGKKGAVNYNFFHLTHQEFLAAFYVSHLSLAEKREIFLQCLDGYNPPELSVVWRFVVGLVGFEDIGWDKYIPWLGRLLCSALPKEKKGEEEEEKDGEEEEKEYRRVMPFLAQCLYEAQEKANWGNPSETLSVTFAESHTSLSPLDCFAVGSCVTASKWVWDLNFRSCGLGPEIVEMLVCGLKSRQEINESIRKLDLSDNPIGAEGVAHLQELPHKILQGISYLDLFGCELDSATLDLLSRLVPTMTSMKKLNIGINLARHGGTVNILKSLSTVNQLQTLDISSITLGPTDIMALSPLIRPSVGSVKKLVIGDEEMTQEHTEMMLEAVLCPSSLESLKLVYVPLTPRVATLLQDNHNLIKLTVDDCTPGTLSHIAEGLHSQTTLRELDVSVFVEQPTTDVIALSEMLRKNRSLKTMTLRTGGFTGQAVQALISALQDNHTLEQFYIIRITGFEFPELDLSDPRVSIHGW